MKYNWDINLIKEVVKRSVNFTEVLDELNIPRQGNNSETLKNILEKNNIDYSHFIGRARSYNVKYIDAEYYLNSNNKIQTSKLKEKLLKEGLIENKCAICGLSSWLNKLIVLQLHHVDGNNTNNNLNNLQLLCPNCHSQTENYCGNANKNKKKYYCSICGKEITHRAKTCTRCYKDNKRKILNYPDEHQLIKDFIELKSFTAIGKKYSVTDNCVRKWFKKFNLPNYIGELSKMFLSNID